MIRGRRVFNIVCSASGLLALSPLFALIAFAIKCDDAGAVFYLQTRIGRDFKPFRLIKFRSMKAGADQAGLLTAPSDGRVIRCGQFLRRYKLDELPQLWNVLRGEMQLVGRVLRSDVMCVNFKTDMRSFSMSRPALPILQAWLIAAKNSYSRPAKWSASMSRKFCPTS
jgi:lipopolysaccharide/colanic/teichoic acid biosynthesis glycosyltransferase